MANVPYYVGQYLFSGMEEHIEFLRSQIEGHTLDNVLVSGAILNSEIDELERMINGK